MSRYNRIKVQLQIDDKNILRQIDGLIFFLPRSTSKLSTVGLRVELMKNYFRNSIGQDRLSQISLLNIQRQIFVMLLTQMDNIKEHFVSKKTRKMNF